MKIISKADVSGKYVLVRGDLDVPLNRQQATGSKQQRTGSRQQWKVVDDFRLQAMLPTLRWLLENHAKVILIGHIGRPQGKFTPELTLSPVAEHLINLGLHIHYINTYYYSESRQNLADGKTNPTGDNAVQYYNNTYHYSAERIKSLFEDDGKDKILLLENLRFDKREQKNEAAFAQELASLADIYVNECFATSHRNHASFTGIPKYLPSYAGFRLTREVEVLSEILKNPTRPLIFVMGGAKTETKIPLVKKIAPLADEILLGGKLMFAQELEGLPHVRFPVDGTRIDDIGPQTIKLFTDSLKNAQTVVWNGPMGRYEEEKFIKGSRAIAETIIKSEAKSIIGGGNTIAALDKLGLRDKMGWISTGGGAMLAFLTEGTLSGIEALE